MRRQVERRDLNVISQNLYVKEAGFDKNRVVNLTAL